MAQIVTTYAEVAKHFSVGRDTVRQYWVPRGMPGEHGNYDLDAIETWRALTMRPSGGGSTSVQLGDIEGGPSESEVMIAKARKIIANAEKERAEAEIKKLDYRKASENLVPVDRVDNFLAELFTNHRRTLARIGLEIKDGYPKELQDRIKQDVDRRVELALRTMQGDIARLAEIKEAE